MSFTTHSLAYDDLTEMPDDGNRYEIIGGVLHVTPAPTPRHQRIVLGLGGRLDNFATDHNLGAVYPAPLDVRLSPSHVVQPDLVFVHRERWGIVGEQFIDGPRVLWWRSCLPRRVLVTEETRRGCTRTLASSNTGSSIPMRGR